LIINQIVLQSVMEEIANTVDPIELWRQRKVLKELESVRGYHTSLITLLIPPGTQLAKLSTLVTQEMGTTSCIKSRITRLSVQESLRSIQSRLKLIT